MKNGYYLLCIILTFLQFQLLAQTNINENEWLELTFSGEDLEKMNASEVDYWLSFRSNPKNLNKLSDIELQTLFSMTYEEVDAFKSYQLKYGKWVSTDELKRLKSWDESLIKLVKNCTYVSSIDQSGQTLIEQLNSPDIHYSLTNVSTIYPLPKAYKSNYYKGIPFQFQTKALWSKKNNYSLGLTLQHDSGELWDWRPSKLYFGIDFTSFHLSLSKRGILDQLILGDYQMIGGQGLVFGGGYFLGKGGDPILNITRAVSEGRPYSSVTESGFQRGGFMKLKLRPNIFLSLLGSINKFDAHLSDSTNMVNSGYHRNDQEFIKKGTLSNYNVGGRLDFLFKNINFGGNFLYTKFSKNIFSGVRKDSLSIFQGRQSMNWSIDLNTSWRNISFFSEIAYSNFGGTAFLLSTYLNLTKGFDVVFSARNYGYNYISLYGNSLSEGTNLSNEEGIYFGFKWKKGKKILIEGYTDLFKFPYPTYRNDSGIEGVEFLGRINYRVNSLFNLFFRLRYKEKGKYVTEQKGITSYLMRESNLKVLFGGSIYQSKKVYIKPSVRLNFYNGLHSSVGYLIAHDFGFELNSKFIIDARIAVFSIEDYNARIYSYEKNIQHAFSFPMYRGRGWKTFLMLKYKVSSKIKIIGRWAKTFYFDQEKIGSSWDELAGDQKNTFQFQAKISF